MPMFDMQTQLDIQLTSKKSEYLSLSLPLWNGTTKYSDWKFVGWWRVDNWWWIHWFRNSTRCVGQVQRVLTATGVGLFPLQASSSYSIPSLAYMSSWNFPNVFVIRIFYFESTQSHTIKKPFICFPQEEDPQSEESIVLVSIQETVAYFQSL